MVRRRYGLRMDARVLLGVWALTAIAVTGCSQSRDCARLAEVANRRSAEIAQIENRQSTTPQTLATDMDALSGVADQVVQDIEALNLSDGPLAEQASRYADNARALSKATQDFSTLMDTLEGRRDEDRKTEAAFEKTGRSLLDACATASAACNDVGDVLRAQPENPEPDAQLEVLGTYTDALEALELEDGPVATAVNARVNATKDYTAMLVGRAALDDDIEAARTKIHDIVDAQNALITELNTTCAGKD